VKNVHHFGKLSAFAKYVLLESHLLGFQSSCVHQQASRRPRTHHVLRGLLSKRLARILERLRNCTVP
jgi:hypothetical protein